MLYYRRRTNFRWVTDIELDIRKDSAADSFEFNFARRFSQYFERQIRHITVEGAEREGMMNHKQYTQEKTYNKQGCFRDTISICLRVFYIIFDVPPKDISTRNLSLKDKRPSFGSPVACRTGRFVSGMFTHRR